MTRILVPSIILAGTAASMFCPQARADQNPYETLQPIVLTDLPMACTSPARLTQPMTSTDLMPLPVGAQWRGYAPATVAPIVEYRMSAPVVPSGGAMETLRPIVAPSVPSGYVVGRGLLGQPKLYKPGQPMRNFLRYLSP
ncbi:MAG: hypothetical protein MUF48_03410 [Pirellulaceae bacterium]|jgi:hypothetical protein|nr:hypothetical protein [Pirellulaceae bacterium]